jgi:pyridoxal phosphate enzyme (YggS family)
MTVSARLGSVVDRLASAAHVSGRSGAQITLVAASKKQPLEAMQEYAVAAQALKIPVVFGENYVQELKSKKAHFPGDAEFHLLGPLQSNKIRDAVRYADVIESVHSRATLEGIAREAGLKGKTQRIFIQVNIGDDPAKQGFKSSEVIEIVRLTANYSSCISLAGLMTITPLYADPALASDDFHKMNLLRDDLLSHDLGKMFQDGRVLLSMGMSDDFELAIKHGADIVRIGTALFGSRD